jgi:polysaccharide pyruvyl transferase CsaB
MGLLKGLSGRHEVTALSGNPAATEAAFGISAVPRKDLNRVTAAIKESDALVFGGGGLMQDTTSLLSLKYYTHLIETAARSGKRVALLGQGIGPIRTMLGKRAAARAFSQCDAILTRDEGSMRLVEQLAGACKARKAVTDDLAWLAVEGEASLSARALAVCARPWKDRTARVIESFEGFCQKAIEDGWQIVPVSFDRGMDDAVLNEIHPGGEFADSPIGAIEALKRVSATVSMRLHGGIFSAALGIVPAMVSYDEKVSAFARSIGHEAVKLDDLTQEVLWEGFQRSRDGAEKLRHMVRERAEIGRKRAGINISMLEETLAGRIR